jgi:hypothetical protein
MPEKSFQSELLLTLGGRPDIRLFRNHRGVVWQGEPEDIDGRTVILRNFRRATVGLAPGAADLIGIQRVIVTPEMVGQPIGRFLSIEAKGPRTRTKEEQEAWLAMVRRFGGYGVIARALDDVEL